MKTDKGISEKIIKDIVARICSKTEPIQIILFGSAASGDFYEHSDIDLLILKKSIGNTREESIELRSLLKDLNYSFDILVMSIIDFEQDREIVGTIAYPAAKYGKVIYEAANFLG